MKYNVLSIQQPFATLICLGIDPQEIKTYPIPETAKGVCLIHASKYPNRKPYSFDELQGDILEIVMKSFESEVAFIKAQENSETIIGAVDFVDSRVDSEGIYLWESKDQVLFEKNIPNIKGKLGIWSYDCEEELPEVTSFANHSESALIHVPTPTITIHDILKKYRALSVTEHYKGAKFEQLIKQWFLSDPRYKDVLTDVWLWEEFPSRKDFGGKDLGIDLVARNGMGDFYAIQCKCYAEERQIDKPSVDSFLATSSKSFVAPDTLQTVHFSYRIWVSTTNKWNTNAVESIKNQNPPVTRIGLADLNSSPVNWELLEYGEKGKDALKEGKKPMKHQLEAMEKTHAYFEKADRGKLIMACGTGKTYTSLKIVEQETQGKGLILFLVPSIALLNQTINAWMADTSVPIKGICICSDPKASRKRKNDFDNLENSVIDLSVPASTNIATITKQFQQYKNSDGLVVVFSTYQSIDVVSQAQQAIQLKDPNYGVFDLIVCDEAHRTTGVKEKNRDETTFVRIHDNEYIKGKKRLYMTATPRMYHDTAKAKATEKDLVLWSMDDEKQFGKDIFRVGFGRAVTEGLLTDYKVLILTIDEEDISDPKLQEKITLNKEFSYDDAQKIIGCINGLSKRIKGDSGRTAAIDPGFMRRAVAFCQNIKSSKEIIAPEFEALSEIYKQSLPEEEQRDVVKVATRHIDGTMDASKRNADIAWLSEEIEDPEECRILTNVRCLSEGVDVPSLDAVLFISARSSEVDIVQSVGRVMRTFHKGQADEKKYGYIIIPVVAKTGAADHEILTSSNYDIVWKILNALRAHDEEFNAMVNKINLNKDRPEKIIPASIGGKGGDNLDYTGDESEKQNQRKEEIARQLSMFKDWQNGLYAKLVEKCGDRMYWENWAKEIGEIAQKFIRRITKIVQTEGDHQIVFREFVEGLKKNLNPSVDEGQAIEMLAQHMITKPVFDALFEDYKFVTNNAVSRSMEKMHELLEEKAVDRETDVLERFYKSVRTNVGNIDNLAGKQKIIKDLYEKFFKGAFPLTVDKLGIVYTPIECVDFILHSVEKILNQEFNQSLTDENVQILDPFTGTGTFITRLLQSKLIQPKDLKRKYQKEIHCNELVLLAYYIADVNIESVFHDLCPEQEYLPYEGICLTDTFELNEHEDKDIFSTLFERNSERVHKQKKAPIRVIIGNPPYSIGQKSANDNAQNLSYERLNNHIAKTYAAQSTASLSKSLYDPYIKAFRWASDRINNPENEEGGIIAFISNGAWLDGGSHDGFRKCLEQEFSSVYVLNLRGNQRTKGELSRKEGGKIFGSGSRTPIAITFLVKKPNKKGKAKIYYHDIGDYLKREEKLRLLAEFGTIDSPKLTWRILRPNEEGDWINPRSENFKNYIPIAPDKKFDSKTKSWFNTYSLGIATNKDVFMYSFSSQFLNEKITNLVKFYNDERLRKNKDPKAFQLEINPTKITWTDMFKKSLQKNEIFYNKLPGFEALSLYRPFTMQKLCFQKELIQRTYQQTKFFPNNDYRNLVICISGKGTKNDFSTLITKRIPNLDLISKTQCFPLYWYEENKNQQKTLFDTITEGNPFIRRDGVSDWVLKHTRDRYHTRNISKEQIFYYVYGLLHSEQYKSKYINDLGKELPRIPIPEKYQDFLDFSNAGQRLATLHLDYEQLPSYPGVKVTGIEKEDFKVKKMKFPSCKKGETKNKSRIIYNKSITIENIPLEAYEYTVNGKSAIEWIMERYKVEVDKKSQIESDPNLWATEHNKPRYILDLLLSVINVSVQTMDVVRNLPLIELD